MGVTARRPRTRCKGIDFATVTAAELDAVADELNDRPRKRFAFATSTEQISELLLR